MSIPSYKTLETPINGLKIHLNKVVGDQRGLFCDLAETDNPIWKTKIKHLHASIAIKKGVARGEHYHVRLRENFWVFSGTALWIFHDFNKESKTFGKTWSLILGFSPKGNPLLTKEGRGVVVRGIKSYFIDQNKLAQIEINPYIYHAFWPLTKEPVIAIATGTTGYDPADFVKPATDEIIGAKKILEKYGINPKAKTKNRSYNQKLKSK